MIDNEYRSENVTSTDLSGIQYFFTSLIVSSPPQIILPSQTLDIFLVISEFELLYSMKIFEFLIV